MDEHRVAAAGVDLFVATAGSPDSNPLLLLHGWPESHRGWQAVASRLSDDYFLIMPDQRGFGRSDLPQGTEAYRMQHLAADAMAVLDHFGAFAAGVVGHDFGGIVAWAVGALYPHRVRRMVVMCAPHPMRFRQGALEDRRQLGIAFYAWLMNAGPAGERLLAARDYAELSEWAFGGSGVNDALREAYKAEWRRPGAFTAMAEWYRANYTPDFLNPDVPLDLPPVTVPVRYIHGEKDKAFVPALATGSGQWVAADYDEHLVAGASHWVVHEQPATVARLVGDWMSRQ